MGFGVLGINKADYGRLVTVLVCFRIGITEVYLVFWCTSVEDGADAASNKVGSSER